MRDRPTRLSPYRVRHEPPPAPQAPRPGRGVLLFVAGVTWVTVVVARSPLVLFAAIGLVAPAIARTGFDI